MFTSFGHVEATQKSGCVVTSLAKRAGGNLGSMHAATAKIGKNIRNDNRSLNNLKTVIANEGDRSLKIQGVRYMYPL